ncbi:SDR family NAD(P)-dependent oxidoreductase [Acidisoma sp. 7E03]
MTGPQGMAPGPALGFVQWFHLGERDLALQAADCLDRLGVRHLRTHLSWADYRTDGGEAWYTWLLDMLGSRFDLLPCLHYTPPDLAINGRTSGPPRDLKLLADFVDLIIDRHGNSFEWLEIWNEPNNLLDWDWRLDPDWLSFCTMFGAAAHWARQRGKKVVLPATSPHDPNWLRLMGERGVLSVVDAVGMHGFPGTWDSAHAGLWPGWPQRVEETRRIASAFNPDLDYWLTETGYSTWRHDPAPQIDAFLAAAQAEVSRVYWYSLRDLTDSTVIQEGPHFDERHYHFGAFDSVGRPKLLGQLLSEGGVPAVQAVAEAAATHPRPALLGCKPVLVTGGAGFIGANLADHLMQDGAHVLLLDALARPGVEQNLIWLQRRHPQQFSFALADIRDQATTRDLAADASAVFHLAGQVAVTTSMENPANDFAINLLGTFNLLEALRASPVPFIFASTNKVYGDLDDLPLARVDDRWMPQDGGIAETGLSESRPLAFATPYGCSKGAADQYVLDYARSFDLPACVLRMSCIYGTRQLGTEDQGWVAHFILRAVQDLPITLYGDGAQVRDLLHVSDAVRTYVAAWKHIGATQGRALNLGGGPANAVSLLELIGHLETRLGRPVARRFEDWRPHDQRYFVTDRRRVAATLVLPEPLDWRCGTAMLLDEIADRPTTRRLDATSGDLGRVFA